MASNLYQFYKSLGQKLPSIAERREQYGLGGGYSGTAEQNRALLANLQGGAVPTPQQPGQQPAQQAPTSTATPTTQTAMGGAMPTDWQGQMAQMEQYRTGQMEQAGVSGLRASIGGLRKQVGETETLLESLRPDIEARTKDYLVPEAFRRRMEAVEREPLTQQLAGLTRGLGMEEQALSGRMQDIDYRTQMAGQLMREQIARETKAPSKGTAGEIKQGTLNQLRKDVVGGANLQEVMRNYSTELDTGEILSIYNINSPHGPAKETEQELYKKFGVMTPKGAPTGAGAGGFVEQISSLPTAGERGGARATLDILNVVNEAITKSTGVPTGPLSAVGAGVSKFVGRPTKTAQLEPALGEILRTIRKESTGVAFAPAEITALLKEVPTTGQQEATVKQNLERLRQRMINKLSTYGIANEWELIE